MVCALVLGEENMPVEEQGKSQMSSSITCHLAFCLLLTSRQFYPVLGDVSILMLAAMFWESSLGSVQFSAC